MILGQTNNTRMIFGAYCHEVELASHPFQAEKSQDPQEVFDPTNQDANLVTTKPAFDSSGVGLAMGAIGGGVLGGITGGIGGAIAGTSIGASYGHPVLGTILGIAAGGVGAGILGCVIGFKAAEH